MGRAVRTNHAIGAVLLSIAVALSAAASGTVSIREADASQPAGAALEWTPCEGGECAQLQVPLDYDKPNGKQIAVALFRIPARQPDQRIGSLLFNPGGPGPSGVEELRSIAAAFPDPIQDGFDLVAFDSRGTGGTLPVDCVDALDPLLDLEFSPDTPKERRALAKEARHLADQCDRKNGRSLAHIGSIDTARDMDRIREAVGDEGLSYFGASYGTYLGALYAELFPDRVRALALDGPVDPALDSVESAQNQAVGFERALTTFFASCGSDPACPFYRNGAPERAYDEILSQLEGQTLRTSDGRPFGPSQFTNGVLSILYRGAAAYSELAAALDAAGQGNGSPLLNASDAYFERQPDGSYSNVQERYLAISCVDLAPIRAGSHKGLEKEFARASRHFGLDLLYEKLACSYWSQKAAEVPKVRVQTAPPAVIFGATGDPATTIEDGRGLARVLPGSVLVEVDSARHVVALASQCTRDIATRYLVDLVVPASGTRCATT